MTRSDLIRALAARFSNLMAKDAGVSIQVILDLIGQSLALGDRVEIRGFGSFSLKSKYCHWPLFFGPILPIGTVHDVTNVDVYEVKAPQLAVDGQIEHGEIENGMLILKVDLSYA